MYITAETQRRGGKRDKLSWLYPGFQGIETLRQLCALGLLHQRDSAAARDLLSHFLRLISDVLTLEDAQRFTHSRDVRPYLGLTRKQRDSGESQPELGINKTVTVSLRGTCLS